MTYDPDILRSAFEWAASHHAGQRVPGTDLPYIAHVHSVFTETWIGCLADERCDAGLALLCAILHDTLEDTEALPEELARLFGATVLRGVRALTKRDDLPKAERMADSLSRILECPREVGMVKLADRIVNLTPPPRGWEKPKVRLYLEEAALIHERLAGCSAALAHRLAAKMAAYRAYT